MYDVQRSIPEGHTVVEREVSIVLGASLDLPTIDATDWVGAKQGDYSANRNFGFPLIDCAVFMDTGSLNIDLQYRRPTFPINDAVPVFTSSVTFFTVGVLPLAWGELSHRLTSRFARIRLTQTGAVNPVTGYVVVYIRSQ